MGDQIQYKCPNCGGSVEFDSSAQKMKCPYCDSEFDVQSLRALDEALENAEPDQLEWNDSIGAWSEGEADGLDVYSCDACGGEIVADANTGATRCPYCDNPVVFVGKFADALRPNELIPFKLDKKAAIAKLKEHLMGKRLLPKAFKDENHIDEVRGVYVPFWLFDADAAATVRYRATQVRSWSDSSYNYRQTSYYSILRSGKIGFDRVPVDGSSVIDDDLMESIEPFNARDAVGFQTAYLAGYLADKYDVGVEESIPRANERVKKSTEDAFARTVTGYNTVVPEQSSVQLSRGEVRYVLYPVWLLNTTWNGQRYMFAMNGQTGKFVGDLPCDSGAAMRWTLGLTGAVGAAVFGILALLWQFAGLDLMRLFD